MIKKYYVYCDNLSVMCADQLKENGDNRTRLFLSRLDIKRFTFRMVYFKQNIFIPVYIYGKHVVWKSAKILKVLSDAVNVALQP